VLFDEGDERSRVDGDVAGAEILNQSHEARSLRTSSAGSMPCQLGQKPGEVYRRYARVDAGHDSGIRRQINDGAKGQTNYCTVSCTIPGTNG
jgi:hypothetical protein